MDSTLTYQVRYSGTGGGSLAHDNYDYQGGAKLTGSIMIFECESIEAVKKIIEEDVYWTEPVVCNIFFSRCLGQLPTDCGITQWDHEKLQIIPFFSPAPVPALMTQA